MVSTRSLVSAAVATLVFVTTAVAQQTAPVAPQAPAATSVSHADALRRSQQVAPTVVQAQGAIRSAQLSTRSALWQFIPALTVTPQMSLQLSNGQSRLDPITGEIISGNSRLPSYSFGGSASYTIFDGFARNFTLKQRRAQQSGADAQLTVARYTSDFNTTSTFFAALGAKQLVDVAQSSVTLAEGQLNLASAKLKAGSGQLSDSLTALGSYLEAKLGLLQAQSNLVVGETNLGRLIGVPGRVAAQDDSAFHQLPPALDTTAIRQEVMSSSPTLMSLQASLTSTQDAYRSAKAGYYPTLTASAAQSWTGYYASGSQPEGTSGLTVRRSLNLTLSVSPWTSYTRETQIENAAIQISNAEANLADQRNFLAAQVNQAYASLSTAEETINVSQAQVVAGNENLRVVTERYRIGVATITEVLTAQQQLSTAAANQVTARYNYLNARAQLEQILGRKL